MNCLFDPEKLVVYQASLAFVAWLQPILEQWPKSLVVAGQLASPDPPAPTENGRLNRAIVETP